MNRKVLLLCLIAFLLAGLSNITAPPSLDANIWRIDTNHGTKWDVSNPMPSFSYASDGNLTIDFNVATDTNFGVTWADLNYSLTNTQGSGTQIVKGLVVDGNRCQTNFIDDWNNQANSDVNLVGYWKFDAQEDDYNTSRAFDYSGNGNHGQYIRNADNNAGGKWDSNAGFFDGIKDYIKIIPLSSTNTFTVTGWIYPTEYTGATFEGIVTESTSNGIFLMGNVIRKLNYYYSSANHYSNTLIDFNNWHYISVVSNAGSVSFYLDGKPDGTASSALTISFNSIGRSTNSVEIYKGNIEELKIYNRALTANEISLDYNLGTRNFRTCSYDWNISGIADANYYANVLARDDAGNSDYNASNNNFRVNASTNTAPDLNIWQVDGYDFNAALPAFSYVRDGNLAIRFRASDAESNDLNFNMWYGATSGAKTSKIIGDINLSTETGHGNCDTNSKAGMVCALDWNTSGIVDSNYWIAIELNDGTDTNTMPSKTSFMVDNTAPTTKDNDFNNTWQNTDANIQFSCSDGSGAGCKNLYYSLDDTNYQTSWKTDSNRGIVLTSDGNHEIFYWSDDLVDNNANAKLIYLAIDKTPPTTIDNDFNNTWNNSDQNIQLKCTDTNSGCKNLYYSLNDTNHQNGWGIGDVNIGISTTGMADGNYAIFYWSDDNTSGIGDNNESAHLIYVAIDKTPPSTPTVSAPSKSTTLSAAITYLATDATSGIKKYWVEAQGGNWFDNGINTAYTFSLGSGESLPATRTYCVKATNNADNNSSEACATTIFEGASRGKITPVQTPPEETPPEIITEAKLILMLEKKYTLSEANLPVLDQTEKQPELQQKRFATAKEITLKRSIKIFALMTESGITGYKNSITIEIENTGSKTLNGVEIIEAIPKEMAENAALIKSDTNYYAIETDPILKFQPGDLQPGEKKSVEYSFERTEKEGEITTEMFNEMKAPVALIQMQPEDECMGILCNDYNPCTRDYCVEGECTYAPMQEEAKCGPEMVCRQGKCVSTKEPETALAVTATKGDTIAFILIIGAIALGLAAQATTKKWKKRKGLWR